MDSTFGWWLAHSDKYPNRITGPISGTISRSVSNFHQHFKTAAKCIRMASAFGWPAHSVCFGSVKKIAIIFGDVSAGLQNP